MKLIGYITLIGCLIALGAFMSSVLGYVSYPYGFDFGEGYLLENARRIVAGENIYGAIDKAPYVVCNYPPLYPLISGILMRIAGEISLTPGRILSVISTLACSVLIIFILLRRTKGQLVSIICGLLFLCIPAVFRWGQVMRVDTFAVALSLAGLTIYIIAPDEKRRYWSIPFFILAFLTKQSMLAAPAAVVVHAITTDRKIGIKYLITLALSALVVYLLVDWMTGWGLYRHNFEYTANVFYQERMLAGIKEYLGNTATVLMICVFFLFTQKSVFRESPVPLYFLLATATLITYGFEGSDTNYFIEPFAAVLVLAGFGVNAWYEEKQSTGAGQSRSMAAGLLMLLLLAQFLVVRVFRADEFIVMNVTKDDAQQGMLLETLMKNTPGDVLSEDASFQVMAGKRVTFFPYIMTLLAERGKWDQSAFVDDLRNAKYKLLVLRFDVNDPNNPDRADNLTFRIAGYNRFSDEMEDAIREAYEIDPGLRIYSGRWWYVYRPKGRD